MSYFSASSVGGGVEPVGPEALVERADLEERLVVEQQPRDALVVLADGDLAHGEVARRPSIGAVVVLSRRA